MRIKRHPLAILADVLDGEMALLEGEVAHRLAARKLRMMARKLAQEMRALVAALAGELDP